MPNINVLFTLMVIAVSLHSWKKHKDCGFFLVVFFGLIVLGVNVLTYINPAFAHVSGTATGLLIATGSYYHWKKFNDKFFFYVLLLTSIGILVGLYNFIISGFR